MSNPHIVSYVALRGETVEDLTALVEEKLDDGYQPFGGISAAVSEGPQGLTTRYAQAMVMYADED